jgi:hypothetical protein
MDVPRLLEVRPDDLLVEAVEHFARTGEGDVARLAEQQGQGISEAKYSEYSIYLTFLTPDNMGYDRFFHRVTVLSS